MIRAGDIDAAGRREGDEKIWLAVIAVCLWILPQGTHKRANAREFVCE
jgi:hypothetical protein